MDQAKTTSEGAGDQVTASIGLTTTPSGLTTGPCGGFAGPARRQQKTAHMRDLRKRRRRGLIVLRSVRLERREIEHLESLGYIDAAQRADRKALADAVEAFISDSVP